jgi:hypothetical protein
MQVPRLRVYLSGMNNGEASGAGESCKTNRSGSTSLDRDWRSFPWTRLGSLAVGGFGCTTDVARSKSILRAALSCAHPSAGCELSLLCCKSARLRVPLCPRQALGAAGGHDGTMGGGGRGREIAAQSTKFGSPRTEGTWVQ